MNDDLPLVTVVTPTFDAAAHLPGCIASVRAQDYPRIEHLVVDGGSRDGTPAVAAGAGVACVSEPDAGLYDAMSKGARLARGELVHILNADDRYAAPTALSTMVAELRARRLDLVHGRARQVAPDGTVVRTFGRDVGFAELRRKMRVAHPTVLVRKAVYERHGAFSVGFRIAADQEFLLRVWRKVQVGFIDAVLVDMQVGGVSTDNANVVRSYREAMAAALVHGANPVAALARCGYEIAKHRLLFARRFALDGAAPAHAPASA